MEVLNQCTMSKQKSKRRGRITWVVAWEDCRGRGLAEVVRKGVSWQKRKVRLCTKGKWYLQVVTQKVVTKMMKTGKSS